MKKMNWRLVFLFALSGLVYAGLTIMGRIHGIEHWVALAMIILVGKFIALLEPRAPIKHGFMAGFLAGLLAILMQLAFSPTYLKNNPDYRDIDIPFGLDLHVYTALFAPVGGLMAGFIAIIVAWPVAKMYLAIRAV